MLFEIDLLYYLVYTPFLLMTLYSSLKWTIVVPEVWMFTDPKNTETGEIVFLSIRWAFVCSFFSLITIILTTVITMHNPRFLFYVFVLTLIYVVLYKLREKFKKK